MVTVILSVNPLRQNVGWLLAPSEGKPRQSCHRSARLCTQGSSIGTEALDLAVLDIAIEDGGISPVAAILRKRGIPFVFATGLDISKAQDKFADTIVLQKPFGAAALDNALHKAAGGD